jgi:hypothetical protein
MPVPRATTHSTLVRKQASAPPSQPEPRRITVGSLGRAKASDAVVPAYDLDRRSVPRPASTKPLFSVVSEEYLHDRAAQKGKDDADVRSARMRRDVFIDLIGDHPVDTYNGSDLQAFVNPMRF